MEVSGNVFCPGVCVGRSGARVVSRSRLASFCCAVNPASVQQQVCDGVFVILICILFFCSEVNAVYLKGYRQNNLLSSNMFDLKKEKKKHFISLSPAQGRTGIITFIKLSN